ncbi:hypothetical protein DACRYDRAFT_52083 [Dacryopinax primogenitus]|uniref:Uncharacterized protein n=1 Tax=Dacryopinax primogenitus (strain DJM 731) TaxID=1858805 RepID=M5FVA3_DACPD|nr:uncharacterized protein DACRYDRAFT_52083 [Dacryopinax primogenitus]EJU01711.1 hypothetical protein DACRYDRAFT_52083 [Dacryopinax primogenitus]
MSKNKSKWPKVVPVVFWAQQISIHSATGMSHFYMAHKIYPLLPMDIIEATWLALPPDQLLSHADLVAFCT